MRIRHGPLASAVLGLPLVRAGRALGQLPLVAKQGVEVAVVPSYRGRGPSAFEATGDGVNTLAAAESVCPAKALFSDVSAFWLGSDILLRICCTVGFTKGMAARTKGHGFLVIHGHARKGLANIPRRSDRIRVAVGPLRIDVDQTHLNGGQGTFELTVAGVALIAQPSVFRTPINVLAWLPDVLAPAGKTESLEAHRIHRDSAGQNNQVSPGKLPAVFLLDRPKQAACLVEVAVVWPAVEGCKSLRAEARATAAISDAVGACAVPGHADEKRAIVAIIRRPPVLRIRHQGMKVFDHGMQVKAFEFFSVIERLAHRIGFFRVLVQDSQVELVRPPVCVRSGAGYCGFEGGARKRAFHFS